MRVFLFGDTVVNYGERTVGEEEGRPTISRALVVFFFQHLVKAELCMSELSRFFGL